MQEIKCPNCGKLFQADESEYAQIVRQVRDKEFKKEIQEREKDFADRKESDLKMARMEMEKAWNEALALKDAELLQMGKEIDQLSARLSEMESEKKLAVSEAVLNQEKEREKLAHSKDQEISEKNALIEKLRERLLNGETKIELAVSKALREKEKELSEKQAEITELKGKISSKEAESKLKEQSLKDQYEDKLKIKDEQIEYYRDFKARQSTKMVGESLERHCMNQFNHIRMTAFPTAYFEKDNDARTGSKGDFIFRESSEDGTEFISIMFEMKNEMDQTASKRKNEDFLKELDKDRREKGCEYAVLVSLLEMDNELYNDGIVDVSYRYEKMYVIRPQFFIPIITLLRNAALNSLQYRRELEVVRNQQVDILHFEENMNSFKKGFQRNYELASKKFKTAVEEIDKTIEHLQKTKDALLSSENNLRLANNKAEDLTIKKLTKNAPSVKELFDGQKDGRGGSEK